MEIRKRKTRMYEPWGYQEQNNYQGSTTILDNDMAKFFASVSYNKDDYKIHFFNIDDEEVGTVDVTEFVKGGSIIEYAKYVDGKLIIKFTNGDIITIDIQELIDENEFEDGLIVNDGVVKVLIDSTGDPYLSVSPNGVKISGIKEELDRLEGEIQSGTSSAITSAITVIEGDIININSAITNIEGDIIDINSAITNINSALTIYEGDINNINSAITNINSAITNIEGDIIEINSSITNINSAITNIEGDIIDIYSSLTEVNSAITNIEGDIVDIYSAISIINSALTETITDVNINEDGDLELMNHDDLLDTVPLTDYYYTKYDISQKELTISAALNDLSDRKIDDVEYKPGVGLRSCGTLKFYTTSDDIKTELYSIDLNEVFDHAAEVNKYFNKTVYEDVTSGESGSEVTYKAINFYNVNESGETLVGSIDARPFLTDGMLENVEIKEISGVTYLAFTFNTASGKQEIDIPLTDFFNPDDYYTKDEVDARDLWVSGASEGSAILKGCNDVANNESEVAAGQFNVSSTSDGLFGDSGNTLFSVGNGTSENDRHNAFEIRQNGDIYMTLDGNDVNLQQVIIEDERVTSDALNDLNRRVTAIEEGGGADLSNYYTKQEVDALLAALTNRIAYLEGLLATDDNGNIPLNQEGEPYE